MKILDMSAGARAVWFDKNYPDAVYVDIRPQVKPDIVADTRALPAEVGTGFGLVLFDPPHKNFAASGNMAKNYGHHTVEEIRGIVRDSAREAHRVSKPDALMAFKWSEGHIRTARVLELLDPWWEPLFGHGVSHQQTGTSWVMLRRRDADPASQFKLQPTG